MRANAASAKLLRLGCIDVLLCVAAIAAWAEPVEKEQAARVANGWYQLRFRGSQDLKAGKAEAMMVFAASDARAIIVKDRVIAHAFDTPGGGCIAIAADDEVSPIVYYCLDERLTVPAVPPAQAILDGFAERMAELQDAPDRKTGRDSFWDKLSAMADPGPADQATGTLPLAPVGPLLTTIWNQGEPYNDRCPTYLGQRCWTGCTSIAMAQIMRFWKYPVTGTGSHSYYWELGDENLYADFGSTRYVWANMPNQLTASSPQAAKDAASLLCYHCGVSVSTQYSPDGSSGSFDGDALTQYFGYKTTQTVERSSYTVSEWFDLMRQQVNMGQPVWYDVTSDDGGHALVLDGHDSPNLVHLNMGWGGLQDGWYTIDHFPPEHGFESNSAIINIHPDCPMLSLNPTSLSNLVERGKNASSQSFDVWISGGGTLTYSIMDDAPWVSCSPTSGSSGGEHDNITVNYVTSNLAAGEYSAQITISAAGAPNAPQTIGVTLTVKPLPPTISRTPSSMTNTCTEGNDAPDQSFEVWNSGGGTLDYSVSDNVSWLSCQPSSGTSASEHDTIVVSYATSGLAPGTYSAQITVSALSATNSPQNIAVNLTVMVPPTITFSPSSLTNTCTEGNDAPVQTFAIWNSGGGTLSYSIVDDATWLSCNPTTGTSTAEHDTIIVNYITSNLTAGEYSAQITISAPGATNSPQNIAVTLIVREQSLSPTITLSPSSLTNTCTEGNAAPAQSFAILNSGGGTLSYSIVDNATWLSCNPTTGTSTGELDNVMVNYATSGLARGTYSAQITVSAPGATNSPQTLPVNLTVTVSPMIAFSPPSLTNTCTEGNDAPVQSFAIWNSGGGTLSYSISSGASWLTCSPSNGSSTGEHDDIQVLYDTSGLSAGTYSTGFTISAPDATNSPQTIAVNLTVTVPRPVIGRSPLSLLAACHEGTNATSQVLQIWNSGGDVLDYSLSDNTDWLALDPTSGTSTGERDSITVTYTSSHLSPGVYPATIRVSAPGAINSPLAVGVTLTVRPLAPIISFSPTFLSNSCDQGTDAQAQTFEVRNSGDNVLNYSISDDAPWLSCWPDSGTSSSERDTILVNYQTSGLSVGEHLATITLTDPAAENSPQVIPVSLFVEKFCAVWYVDGGAAVSGDGLTWRKAFKTIQEGIEAASECETVNVAEGVYVERIHFSGKSIKVASTNPFSPSVVANTVIDGGGAGPTVTFAGAENQTCALSGFTIRNGNAFYGGGICGGATAQHTRATIRDNVLENNSAQLGGAICWCDGNIQNNIIRNNSASRYGGGLFDCDGTIRNNLIAQNTAQKSGGGASNCGGELESCTFVGNSALENAGGGLYLCTGAIADCIIWGNVAPTGAQTANSSIPSYSCIEGWTQGGDSNIALSPRFSDPGAGNYHLSPDSACIDSGLNKAWMEQAVDLDGKPRILRGTSSVTVDMGAYEYGSPLFQIVSIGPDANGGIRLTWSSLAGKTYSVYHSSDMVSWDVLKDDVASAGDTVTTWIDSLGPALPPGVRIRYYKVMENQ